MSSNAPGHPRPVPRFWLIAFAVFAVLSVGRTLQKTASPVGGLDFHPYWYQGQNLRRGVDPYQAGLDGREVMPPVRYLDGKVTTQAPVAQPGLNRLVVNTAPLALLLFQFSWFSWPLAKWLWTLVNLPLALLVPYLVIRSFPERGAFDESVRLLLHLLFLAFMSTRVSLWLGQTTLVVFSLMLATWLLRERNWPLSGLALGLALSKYSLALPMVLFLLVEARRRNWLILAVAGLVQVAGACAVAYLSRETPWAVLQDYIRIFRRVAASTKDYGIQISALVPLRGRASIVGPVLTTILMVILMSLLWRRMRWPAAFAPLAHYCGLMILTVWTLLVAYHGIYDAQVVVLIIPALLYAIGEPKRWQLSPLHTGMLIGILGLTILVLSLPGEIAGVLLAPQALKAWLWAQARAQNMTLFMLLAVSLWLLLRLRRAAGGPAAGTGK